MVENSKEETRNTDCTSVPKQRIGRKSVSIAEDLNVIDAPSEATTVVSPAAPLKGVLKKSNLSPTLSYLEDDTSTVISASTINTAQLRRANVRCCFSNITILPYLLIVPT